MPSFVVDFEMEQRELRDLDAANNPDLLQRAKDVGKERPAVSLQAALNLKTERERLDHMASLLGFEHVLAAYEHDGLFIWRPPTHEKREGWDIELKNKVGQHIEVT